jgi:hypothetical protein
VAEVNERGEEYGYRKFVDVIGETNCKDLLVGEYPHKS